MTTSLTHLCAVGDSFVYGDEIIETNHWEEFCIEQNMNWVGPRINDLRYKRYKELLDSTRFSSLVAKELNLTHINYAARGASQEGIKFQTYLLANTLKQKGIDPASTMWLVGITLPGRQMFLKDAPKDSLLNTGIDQADINFIWSQYTNRSLMLERREFGEFTPNFIKEYAAEFTDTTQYTTWLMNLIDIVHLLKSIGVQQFRLLNIFNNQLLNFTSYLVPDAKLSPLLKKLSSEIEDHMLLPSRTTSLDIAAGLDSTVDLCPRAHYNQTGHRKVADYLIAKIS